MSLEEEEGDTETHTQRNCHVKMEAEIGVMDLQDKKHQGLQHGESHGTDSPFPCPRRNQPCRHFDFRLLAYRTLWA